jgi:hypothetical protein
MRPRDQRPRTPGEGIASRWFGLIPLIAVLFSAPVFSQEEEDDLDLASGGRRGRFGRVGSGIARVRVEGKDIRIMYGKTSVLSNEFMQLETLQPGKVVVFYEQAATKLQTEANLKVGDKLIRADNVAPDYPGIYTLWLKKTDQGWSLVFNEDGDIWGTMHNPENDRAELELKASETDHPSSYLDFKLDKNEEEEKKLKLTIKWGKLEWVGAIEIE